MLHVLLLGPVRPLPKNGVHLCYTSHYDIILILGPPQSWLLILGDRYEERHAVEQRAVDEEATC